ncbi:glycosyl hydrolase catalytic core-domain-containing protein [Immersiella caudata]|uniref:Glycosyl hydrolase catalytic core-domain-containing protein n=1 Tax=Immersiella caudata TaxID=314043 RepID=A0AA40C0P6_9PEZI|nr:glycosyl hydrolase catalytic core-domain-containing protein [Immersiella caudata]
MISSIAPLGLLLLSVLSPPLAAAAGPTTSPKRGLVYVPDPQYPGDDHIWTRQPSALTWYYNYQANPSPVYAKISQSVFEFVPMLWGAPEDPDDTTFLKQMKALVQDRKVNITNVLAFNEPDGPHQYGGSNIDPEHAAKVWVKNIEPLREMGIRVGLPACTGAPDGLAWLKTFLDSCSEIVSEGSLRKNCTYDFVTIHWYGTFEALASHMGQYAAAFPNKTMWITEYNLDHQDLASTQAFYNITAEYFDRLDHVERYSIFGSFRSDVSNVGPNGALLSADGQLTDIGRGRFQGCTTCLGCCDKLLDITRRLSVKSDSRAKWWRSLEKALYDTGKNEDVDDLRQRIRNCQMQMTLHLCAISSENANNSSAYLRRLIAKTNFGARKGLTISTASKGSPRNWLVR